jgi:hypothetical protein
LKRANTIRWYRVWQVRWWRASARVSFSFADGAWF